MTVEQKTTQENQNTPFDMSSCMAMMQKMMARVRVEGFNCSEVFSQATSQGECSCGDMMSQMFANIDEEDTDS